MAYEYIGDGQFIPGVPARDLTDAEAKQYEVTKSPLYRAQKSKRGAGQEA